MQNQNLWPTDWGCRRDHRGRSGNPFRFVEARCESYMRCINYCVCPKAKARFWSYHATQSLRTLGKQSFEAAGFTVVPAMDDSAVEQACSSNGIQLIMLGYSLAPSDKRRVWAKSRQFCNVPILELHKGNPPELVERNVFAHESKHAEDFLHSVERLLRKPKNG